jgi:hypothetical protein
MFALRLLNSSPRIFLLLYFLFADLQYCAAQSDVNPIRACKYPAKTIDDQPIAGFLPPDPVLEAWQFRALHYLVMGVSGITANDEGDADFAKADVTSFVSALKTQGFRPLPGSIHGSVLIGKDATIENLNEEITENLPNVPAGKRPLLVLYYAGHGEVDPVFHNLVLWPRNAKSLNIKYSFSLKEQIRKIRTVYAGDLLVILDACYSGQAVEDLSNNDLSSRTAVLASSSDKQTSEAIKPIGSTRFVSAFTYALGEVLHGADTCDPGAPPRAICKATRSGILGIAGLQETLENNLSQLTLSAPMSPSVKLYLSAPGAMLGYFCEAVKDPFDVARRNEVAAQRLINALNGDSHSLIAGPFTSVANNEALGIVDGDGDLMATVSAFKVNGKVAAVSFDTIVNNPLGRPGRPTSNLTINKLNPSIDGSRTLNSIATLSPESSSLVTDGIDAQINYTKFLALSGTDPQVEQKLETSPLLLQDATKVSAVLSNSSEGKVTFGTKSLYMDRAAAAAAAATATPQPQ